MKQKLAALIETRKLVTFAMVALFVVMALTGKLEVAFVQVTIGTVVGFYFGQSTARDNPKKNE
jgi:hypothetical protein